MVLAVDYDWIKTQVIAREIGEDREKVEIELMKMASAPKPQVRCQENMDFCAVTHAGLQLIPEGATHKSSAKKRKHVKLPREVESDDKERAFIARLAEHDRFLTRAEINDLSVGIFLTIEKPYHIINQLVAEGKVETIGPKNSPKRQYRLAQELISQHARPA